MRCKLTRSRPRNLLALEPYNFNCKSSRSDVYRPTFTHLHVCDLHSPNAMNLAISAPVVRCSVLQLVKLVPRQVFMQLQQLLIASGCIRVKNNPT